MQPTCEEFPAQSRAALLDDSLQAALAKTSTGFPLKRLQGIATLPEFEAMRDRAVEIRNHVLDHLDFYLEQFEAQVVKSGGKVHWCTDADEARATILKICQAAGARTVTKGKTMIGEEISINEHLEAHGIVPIETDLGEYIIQLRNEPPSHIIAPAIHVSKQQVGEAFRKHHVALPADRDLDDPQALLSEARAVLRQHFLAADVGITGANMLVAETGSTLIVTNEGNGDLTQTLPRVHVVLASIEKAVPTLDDATTLLRVLARSITGQEQAVYNTFSTGPRREGDADGPQEFHVVLIDNGRSKLLDTPARDILRCIRCGACLGHCPVYTAVGGHAYGWCYSGPMGAALAPAILGLEATVHLPQATTSCGRCEEICPVRIPIPKILRYWREQAHAQGIGSPPAMQRWGMRAWGFLARRPALYHRLTSIAAALLARLGRGGRLPRLPGLQGLTESRDLPAPEGRTFQSIWSEQGGRR